MLGSDRFARACPDGSGSARFRRRSLVAGRSPDLAHASVVIDARWRSLGGVGVAVDLIIRALAEIDPPGSWTVWGIEVDELAALWPAARAIPLRPGDSPRRWGGQRGAMSRPRADVVLATHQLRPLWWRGRVVQILHDTVPLSHRHRLVARLRKTFLRRIANSSRVIVTVSDHARDRIARDLDIDVSRIDVLRYPVDPQWLAQAAAGRARSPRVAGPYALCLAGRAAPHKNVERLVEAFASCDFCARGGRLVFTGADEPVAGSDTGVCDWLGDVSRDDVAGLVAHARAVVVPSIDEGFGFPAWEARCAGIPVAASAFLGEAAGPDAEFFDPLDVADMSAAIDRAAERLPNLGAVPEAPTLRDFGVQIVGVVSRSLVGRSGAIGGVRPQGTTSA